LHPEPWQTDRDLAQPLARPRAKEACWPWPAIGVGRDQKRGRGQAASRGGAAAELDRVRPRHKVRLQGHGPTWGRRLQEA